MVRVLTVGVYDYFHLGHLRLFENAREYGDYLVVEGKPVRRRDKETTAPYLYGGVMICHARVFDNEPEGKYWLIDIFDRLQREGRLGYYIHQDKWFHVGDPEATKIAEAYFSK